MRKSWSIREVRWLQANVHKRGIKGCARYLKRSKISVQRRYDRLGLGRQDHYWGSLDDERLREMYQNGEPVAIIAAQIGRTVTAIRSRVAVLKLRRKPCPV